MLKNLIFFHSDTLNQTWFWQYQTELSAFWQLKAQSMYFRNCHASGTSTIFALNSISYGSISGLDSLETYTPAEDGNASHDKPVSLLELLHEKYGYHETFFQVVEDIDRARFFYKKNLPGYWDGRLIQDPSQAGTAFEDCLGKEPFCWYVHNLFDLSHMYGDIYQNEKLGISLDLSESYRNRMRKTNAVLAALINVLRKNGRLENTMIVVFGDHGNAMFTRTQAYIECYRGTQVFAESAWVPMFIYNSSLGTGVTDKLASLDDLRATVLGLLFPEDMQDRPGLIYSGINLARESRDVAFTQNKYALQDQDARPGETRKSYAVVDGSYRLVAMAPDAGRSVGGMGLYLEQIDPSNCTNLLDLFVLDEQGHVVDFNGRIMRLHNSRALLRTFSPASLVWMAKHYEKLRDKLREYVRTKEQHAVGMPGANAANTFPPEAFLISSSRSENALLGKGMGWLAREKRDVLLFGAAEMGRQMLGMFRFLGIQVIGFMDNDREKWNGEVDGVKVYSPEKAAELFHDAVVVGCACWSVTEKAFRDHATSLGFEYYSYTVDLMGLPVAF